MDRTEKFQKASNNKYAQEKNWIEKKLKEGKWEQVRDISKKSSPALNAEPETPMSPKRPIEAEEGKGKRIKFPNPKYNDPALEIEPVNLNIPSTLNFDTLGLEDDEDNDDENFEPPKKKQPKPLKRKRKNLQHTILAGERCGLTDFQIAVMYNAGSL